MSKKIGLVWLRRDIRLHDHHALAQATHECDVVYLTFNFDPKILNKIDNKSDQRISFIFDGLCEINQQCKIIVTYGEPELKLPALAQELKITDLYYNYDYEPYAEIRDRKVTQELKKINIHVHSFLDHLIFAAGEIKNGSNEVYKVFTPFKKKWLEVFSHKFQHAIPEYKVKLDVIKFKQNEHHIEIDNVLGAIGFKYAPPIFNGGTKEALKRLDLFKKKISDYKNQRDFPSIDGTSNLSAHLRHGNLSVRQMVKVSLSKNDEGHSTWLSEIVWREFYHHLLHYYPEVTKLEFQEKYRGINWPNDKRLIDHWIKGTTGYPIIDASMRCFAKTGLIHNRLRMVVSSFLCKTLLVDWRIGEEYFRQHLFDYDLAANNGGWQWSASTGCDAQPYFRIFNPELQSKKFDKDGEFIKIWCPELSAINSKDIHNPSLEQRKKCHYPTTIVDYKSQKEMALVLYKSV